MIRTIGFTSATILILMIFVSVNAKLALASSAFYRPLSVGVSGEDVRELQKILNSDNTTKIQGFGAGSSGQETTYFGLLTKEAVVRFQEKYRQEILAPNFLQSGTGNVGPSTLAVLSSLESGNDQANTASPNTTSADSPVKTIVSIPPEIAQTNPNLKNLDKFLGAIEAVSKKKGFSTETIAKIETQVIKDAATTTDLTQTFVKIVKQGAVSSKESGSLFAGVLEKLSLAVEKVFMPAQANASAGIPFGGALLYPYFCTCSFNWLIALSPLPPSFVVLLSYEPFSQAFLSYNIPFTRWLLGTYVTPGTCLVYIGYGCLTIPSEGYITPMVGSSPF